MPGKHVPGKTCPCEECQDMLRDALRYRHLRNSVFTRDIQVGDYFSGDVIISPPRLEVYERGLPIMTSAATGPALDAAIDAALGRGPKP